jgi:hypothetical protein
VNLVGWKSIVAKTAWMAPHRAIALNGSVYVQRLRIVDSASADKLSQNRIGAE